ncbi:MAG: hypothetical protein PWQ49_393 [Methanohalophilus sp.]|nr:hypothetical protein [Methanohalophilus sp.]
MKELTIYVSDELYGKAVIGSPVQISTLFPLKRR